MAAANAGVREIMLWCMAFLHQSFPQGLPSAEARVQHESQSGTGDREIPRILKHDCSMRVRLCLV